MTGDSELPLSLREGLKGLYQRVGGDAAIEAILRDFYARMSRDVLIGFFFDGKDTVVIADQQKAFLLRAMGVTPSYSGLPPARAHQALPPILRGHFDRRLRILEETLGDHGVTPEDIRIWVAFEEAFRDAVVS